MSTGTIERTALAGGDGDDSPYIEQGIKDAEAMLKAELDSGVGEFVIEPVVFAPYSLGAHQRARRQQIGIHRGGFVLHKRHLIDFTPERGNYVLGEKG
jgi:hypothetical protein